MNPFGDQAIDGLMDFSYNSPPPLPPPSSPLEKRGGGGGGKRGTRVKLSTDPQSVAARQRRHRISDRFRILKSLVPGGSKMDTVSMLEEAIHYVKFLKTQIWLHQAALMLPPPMDDPCHASPYHAQAAANNNIACGYGNGGSGNGSSSFGTCQMVVPTQEMVSYSSMQLPPLPCYYHQDEEMMPNLG